MSELKEFYYYEDRVITPATHIYRVYHADEADKVIAKLKRKIEFLKVTHGSCGDCNKCADGMGKVFDETLNELKAQKAQLEDDVAFWKAKAKGEM